MANIIQYLQDIMSARYGKDVRQSIHDAIEEINNVNEANIGTVQAIADTAQGYASDAQQSATSAQTAQTGAETAQTNAETAEDGAEHFYNETVAIVQTLSNAIIARGTIAFADLPDVSSTAVKNGFMWNISDNFTTTSDFVEGAGVNIPMGANVYKVTINNVPKWDVLAGTSAAVFVGTEAQIAQAEAQGLISENTMVISLDGEMPYELTSSMILHGSESVENKLDDIDDSITQINSDLSNKANKSDLPWVFKANMVLNDTLDVTGLNELLFVLQDSNLKVSRGCQVIPINWFQGGNLLEINAYVDQRRYANFSYSNGVITLYSADFGTYVNVVTVYGR